MQRRNLPFTTTIFFSTDQDPAPQVAGTHDIKDGYCFLKPHDLSLSGLDLTILS